MAQNEEEKQIARQKLVYLEHLLSLNPQVQSDFLIFNATPYITIQLFLAGQIHQKLFKKRIDMVSY